MKDEKIAVLTNEIQIIRTEIIMQVKTIHGCIFSFIASIGIFLGILATRNTTGTNKFDIGMLIFFISQIEIVIVIYSILLMADVINKAAYMASIEDRINSLLSEKLIFWETKMSRFMQKRGGAFLVSQLALFTAYLSFFIVLCYFCYGRSPHHIYLWIQIAEVVLVAFLQKKLAKEYGRASQFISTIKK